MYTVFVRNWWKMVNGKKVPNPSATKKVLCRVNSQDEARAICEQWNSTHEPGRLSRKAEYMSGY